MIENLLTMQVTGIFGINIPVLVYNYILKFVPGRIVKCFGVCFIIRLFISRNFGFPRRCLRIPYLRKILEVGPTYRVRKIILIGINFRNELLDIARKILYHTSNIVFVIKINK
jgi:hypothetical protein